MGKVGKVLSLALAITMSMALFIGAALAEGKPEIIEGNDANKYGHSYILKVDAGNQGRVRTNGVTITMAVGKTSAEISVYGGYFNGRICIKAGNYHYFIPVHNYTGGIVANEYIYNPKGTALLNISHVSLYGIVVCEPSFSPSPEVPTPPIIIPSPSVPLTPTPSIVPSPEPSPVPSDEPTDIPEESPPLNPGTPTPPLPSQGVDIDEEDVPMDDLPKTGDDDSARLILAAMFFAAGGIAVVLTAKRVFHRGE